METNRLLAEYLGLKFYIHAQSGEVIKGSPYAGDDKYKFSPDKDYNDLMMVVEKIEEDENVLLFNIHGRQVDIYYYSGQDTIFESKTKHKAVYNACVEHIENKYETEATEILKKVDKEKKKNFIDDIITFGKKQS